MNNRQTLFALFAITLSILLGGCTKDLPPANYDASEVGKIKKVRSGIVLSIRPVNIRNKAIDNNNPTNPNVASDNVPDTLVRSHGLEFVIRLNSGEVISLVQTDSADIKVKQRVLVIYGENTRLVADNGDES